RVLDVVAEDPEVEHVPADVEQAAVEKHRGEDRDEGGWELVGRRAAPAEPARDRPELGDERLDDAGRLRLGAHAEGRLGEDLEEREVPGLSRVRPPIERKVPEEVGFRPRELLAADRRLANPLELGEETRLGRGGVLGRRAEVRDEEAGSGPERYQDPERIREPALFPELDEESARHPAAEHGAQHADGGIRRVAEPGPEVADEDLRLLGRPLENAP